MRALKAKKILLRHWIAVLTVALLAGLLVPFFAGRTRSATAESYAEYDKGQNAVILENENVRRVISFYEGMFVTTEYRDRKAGVTYVSATAPQNEFSMYIDRDGVRQEVRSDSVRFGNWSYVSHENTVLSQGELQISVTLENEILRVTKYYVLYPGTSVIQEWTAVKNISGEALLISMPNIVEKRLSGIDGASSDFMYMTGNANFSGASMLKTIDLSGGYRRLFYSRDNPEVMEVHGWYLDQVATTTMGAGVYNEFFAVHDRSSQNGVFFTHGGKGYTVTEKGNFLGGIAHRVWQSAPTQPFGCRALLMEVCARSKGPFLLQIKSDEGSRALCFAGGLCRKRVLLAGTVFSFRVQAEECELYALSAVFQRGEDKV